MEQIGFVIIRHINSEQTNELWQNCYLSIRKFYPENKIMIVDDNSDQKFVNSIIPLTSCQIVNSEYPKAGELLGYYYFYKLKPFKKAVILHDSVFINKYIEFSESVNIKFLWSFSNFYRDILYETFLIRTLSHAEDLLKTYNEFNWSGCFGVQTVMTLDYLTRIEEKYNLFSLLQIVKGRRLRMGIERLMAIIAFTENQVTQENCSFFGDIHQYIDNSYSYSQFIKDRSTLDVNRYPLIKIRSNR